jgi:hypothetical protein
MAVHNLTLPAEVAEGMVKVVYDEENQKINVYHDPYRGRYGSGFFHGHSMRRKVTCLHGEILFFKHTKEGTWMHTVDDTFLVDESIDDILRQVGDTNFLRISKFVLVNVHRIKNPSSRSLTVCGEDSETHFGVGPEYRKQCSIRFGLDRHTPGSK